MNFYRKWIWYLFIVRITNVYTLFISDNRKQKGSYVRTEQVRDWFDIKDLLWRHFWTIPIPFPFYSSTSFINIRVFVQNHMCSYGTTKCTICNSCVVGIWCIVKSCLVKNKLLRNLYASKKKNHSRYRHIMITCGKHLLKKKN